VGEPARPALARLLSSVIDDVDVADAERVADLTVRMVVSWILNPPPEPVEDAAAGLAGVLARGLESTVDIREGVNH